MTTIAKFCINDTANTEGIVICVLEYPADNGALTFQVHIRGGFLANGEDHATYHDMRLALRRAAMEANANLSDVEWPAVERVWGAP